MNSTGKLDGCVHSSSRVLKNFKPDLKTNLFHTSLLWNSCFYMIVFGTEGSFGFPSHRENGVARNFL